MKKALVIGITLLMLMSGMLVMVNESTGSENSIEALSSPQSGINALVSHDPIRINSNADFDASHGVTGGSGTQSDPYIIENYDIDAQGGGDAIYIGNTDVYFVIRNCKLYDARHGVTLYNVQNGTITNNIASNNWDGVYLDHSSNNTISNNIASNNDLGIYLYSSNGNTITANTMVDDGIFIEGDQLQHWNTHTIDATNTVNGKPVYYWKNRTGGTVPSGAGEVILANCTNVIVENQNVSDGTVGIELGFSNGNTIFNNTANSNNWDGIDLSYSSSNTISNNNLNSNDDCSITLFRYSSSNRIYHNNFINNTIRAADYSGTNFWNASYPTGGNYWSDYNGIDKYSGPNQDQSGSDGIGDTQYRIYGSAGAQDNYPLMEPVVVDTGTPSGIPSGNNGENGNSLLWISLIIVVIVVIAAFAAFLMKNRKKPQEILPDSEGTSTSEDTPENPPLEEERP